MHDWQRAVRFVNYLSRCCALVYTLTHFVNFGLAILYRGAGIEAVWPEFLIVAGIGAGCFAVALMRFRRMIVLAAGA
jgi:hypothetical protein